MHHSKELLQPPARRLMLKIAAIVATLSAIIWGYRDYQDFLALGPGGAPYNVKGWAWVTFLRLFALSKRGALGVSDYPSEGAHEEIKALPRRGGLRASIGGIIPHRQLSQHAGEEMIQYITEMFKNVVAQNSELLESRLSLYEKHNPAIFVRQDLLMSKDGAAPETAHLARGEVGHVHPDYSIHLYLSPADARKIIEKGWGERHRLSKPSTSIFQFKKFHVADTYLMIYGPRNDEELKTVSKILQSSVRFMTGREDVTLPQWTSPTATP